MQDNFYNTRLFLEIILKIKLLEQEKKEVTISSIMSVMDIEDMDKREKANLRIRIRAKLDRMVKVNQLSKELKFIKHYSCNVYTTTDEFQAITS